MFWRFGGYANISTIDTILDKPDVTVEELLDESDLIQELKQQNSKLVEYLRDEKVLERLLRYVVSPKPPGTPDEDPEGDGSGKGSADKPNEGFFDRVRRRSNSKPKSDDEEEENKEEKQRLKYAYVACEILASDIWSISEAVLENQDSLRSFWQYIKQPAPLDPVQAGYFTKVNEALLDRKTEEMLEFFRSIDNVVSDMLEHVDSPMIMDLLLKIISLDKMEGGAGIVDWLQSQNLIPILLSYLSPENSASTQTSAGDFLKAIITLSANATTQDQSVIGPNELTRQLVSESCIKTLIDDMLRGGNPLTVGVGIIIEVIRKNNSDYDLESQIGPVPKSSDPIYLGTLLRQFANNIPKFMELVHNNNHVAVNSDGTTTIRKRELKAAFGEKIEPLGFDRFKTCELMAELLHCSNMALLNERGSESDVKRRDAERERLKAEGKLVPSREGNIENDFGTSVDSHGFHHARAPSCESPEEIKKLEVQNASEEDEFEKVASPHAIADDIREEFEEHEIGAPLERSAKANPEPRETDAGDNGDLSKDTLTSQESSQLQVKDQATEKPSQKEASSPTSAVLSEIVDTLDISKELESHDSTSETSKEQEGEGEQATSSPSSKQSVSLITQQLNQNLDVDPYESPLGISPHPDDRPAPLFSGKRAPKSPIKEEAPKPPPAINLSDDQGSDITPIEDTGSAKSVLLSGPEGDLMPQYEVDIDGSPVVGDLLKMMFVQNKVVPTILNFFFRFPWNNFLHNVVYDVVQQVFNGHMDRGYNRSLAIDLFETGRITERIIEGQQASDKSQAETNMRLGYMGHLTLIAEEVLKFTERHTGDLLSSSVLERVTSPAWIDYVEQTLAETRERDNAILGGVRPEMAIGSRASGLGGDTFGNVSSLGGTGLSGGSIGLDSMSLGNVGGSGGYTFTGGSLLSGFTSSSDEEDEEMEEGDRDRDRDRQTSHVSDSDQVGELSFEDVEMDYR